MESKHPIFHNIQADELRGKKKLLLSYDVRSDSAARKTSHDKTAEELVYNLQRTCHTNTQLYEY